MNKNYETPEDKARHEKINPLLEKAGWKVQHYKSANIHSSKGIAVEFFEMGKVGQADYTLFVNGQPVGIVEAKREGSTLIGKEPQTAKYSEGLSDDYDKLEGDLPFLYESTGTNTRFTNKWDPKSRSREVFAFHKPETLEKWIKSGKEENLRHNLSLKKKVRKILRQIKEQGGNVGKPLKVSYFREKRFEGKRLYFLAYKNSLIILALAISDKKTQQETIDAILSDIESYKSFIQDKLKDLQD
jgi:type I site-specific restriction endonuclease